MNQSNKALREAAIRKLRNADHAKCYEPAWHRDTADILIALVTNHIKGLPSMQMEGAGPYTHRGFADLTETSLHEAAENIKRLARDDVRHQLLKDMGAE